MQEPSLAEAARLYRQSAQQWERLAEILISSDDPSLKKALQVLHQGKWSEERQKELREVFVQSKGIPDIPFRLSVFNQTLERIIQLEKQGADLILTSLTKSYEAAC